MFYKVLMRSSFTPPEPSRSQRRQRGAWNSLPLSCCLWHSSAPLPSTTSSLVLEG